MPPAVIALGLVSLFMDTSSEWVHCLLPIFLSQELGASRTSIGLIEGMGEAMALFVKVVAGPLSDRFARRKPWIVLGYTLSTLSKPLFAIAISVPAALTAKIIDRTGKGLRGAPRDAMIVDLVPKDNLGEAFGIRQSLDTIGAFVGPLIALVILTTGTSNIRTAFLWATVPAILSVLTLIFFVRERPRAVCPVANQIPFVSRSLSKSFWIAIALGFFLQLCRLPEAFMILRVSETGLTLNWIPAVHIAFNIVYSAISYPVGRWSDKVGRAPFWIASLLVLAGGHALIANAESTPIAFAAVALIGLHMGLSQGILTSMVAVESRENNRGTVFGIMAFSNAVGLILAGIGGGFLWDHFGPQPTFLAATGLSLGLAVVSPILLRTPKSPAN